MSAISGSTSLSGGLSSEIPTDPRDDSREHYFEWQGTDLKVVATKGVFTSLVNVVDAAYIFDKLERHGTASGSVVLHESRQRYLDCVAEMCRVIGISVTTKDYRHTFPAYIRKVYFNKRGKIMYPEDCLYAAADCCEYPMFQINGKDYEFSSDALNFAAQLTVAHRQLLEYLIELPQRPTRTRSYVLRTDLKIQELLYEFDHKWSAFEQTYTREQEVISSVARAPLLKLVESAAAYQNATGQMVSGSSVNEADELAVAARLHNLRQDFLNSLAVIGQLLDGGAASVVELTERTLQTAEEVQRYGPEDPLHQHASTLLESFQQLVSLLHSFAGRVQRQGPECMSPALRENEDIVRAVSMFRNAYAQFGDLSGADDLPIMMRYLSDALGYVETHQLMSLGEVRKSFEHLRALQRMAVLVELRCEPTPQHTKTSAPSEYTLLMRSARQELAHLSLSDVSQLEDRLVSPYTSFAGPALSSASPSSPSSNWSKAGKTSFMTKFLIPQSPSVAPKDREKTASAYAGELLGKLVDRITECIISRLGQVKWQEIVMRAVDIYGRRKASELSAF